MFDLVMGIMSIVNGLLIIALITAEFCIGDITISFWVVLFLIILTTLTFLVGVIYLTDYFIDKLFNRIELKVKHIGAIKEE